MPFIRAFLWDKWKIAWNEIIAQEMWHFLEFIFSITLEPFQSEQDVGRGRVVQGAAEMNAQPNSLYQLFFHDSIMSSGSNCNNSTISSTNRNTNNNSAFYEKCHNRYSDKSWNVIDDLNPWQPWFALNDSIKSSTFISLSSVQIRSYETINYVS